MNFTVAIFANFETTPLGRPAALGAEIGGRPVLEHTLRRVAQVAGVTQRCLVIRETEREAARRALDAAGLAERFELVDDLGMRPRQPLIRTARKWALESWRGGPLGLTWYDEFVDIPAAAQVLARIEADAVLCVEGHQSAFDPRLAEAMIAHAAEFAAEAPFVFTQAPPGLAGVLLGAQALADLLAMEIPFGLLLAYRPEIPQGDPITSPMCLHIAPHVEQLAARFVADTRRSREILTQAFADCGADADAETLCRWYQETRQSRSGSLPADVEIELTTEDPLPDTTLRPRGVRVPRRTLGDVDVIRRVAAELAVHDDRAAVLGGHGDPLCHPRFGEVCRLLREAGVLAVGVVSPLVDMPDAAFEALLSGAVDLLEVQLDAHTAPAYAAVHARDAFQRVRENLARLIAARADRQSPQPLLVPSLTRSSANWTEIEEFYDHWIRTAGSAVVRGYNTYGGLLSDDVLLPTFPPMRTPCRRIAGRLVLLADGRAAACTQDVTGAACVGDWRFESLAALWAGSPLQRLRDYQNRGAWDELPVCRGCMTWNEA